MSDSPGFAFPSGDTRGVQPDYGLTKREWFAGMALQGLLSNSQNSTSAQKTPAEAFKLADAMLAESKKP